MVNRPIRPAIRVAVAVPFVIYLVLLLKLILFKMPPDTILMFLQNWRPEDIGRNVNLVPFVTIRQFVEAYRYGYLNENIILENLLGNMVCLIPWGISLPILFVGRRRWRSFLPATLLFILGIETVQLVTGLGIFDVDDILLNMIGAVAGFAMWRVWDRIQMKIREKNLNCPAVQPSVSRMP